MLDIIKPKRPISAGWTRLPDPHKAITLGYTGEAYEFSANGLYVISAVEVAKDPDGIDKGPEYHVSISRHGKRCTSADALWVLSQFDMLDAEEDNHVPFGIVRNFWRPVADSLVGIECACKKDEPAIVEDKGDYVWRGVTA